MEGNIIWTILLIAAIIFVIYAVIISTNPTMQAWGNLILGIILIWLAVTAFMTAYQFFHAPQPQVMYRY